MNGMLLFDFQAESDLQNWRVVDDVVMGGRSDGSFGINEEGHGVFQGEVSLENNGGFSSVRYNFPAQKVDAYQKINLRLKGDGNKYQFRLKKSWRDRYSYIHYFISSGDWETISIPLSDFEPAFRGRMLNLPNFPNETLEEIAILIGNKEPQSFLLELDRIWLE